MLCGTHKSFSSFGNRNLPPRYFRASLGHYLALISSSSNNNNNNNNTWRVKKIIPVTTGTTGTISKSFRK
jgi:hypothetical protein